MILGCDESSGFRYVAFELRSLGSIKSSYEVIMCGMLHIAQKRSFMAGTAFGIAIAAMIATAFYLWPAHRTQNDAAIYDSCLVQKEGNTVACDAMMRVLARHRNKVAEMDKEAARMLASGSSKRDVVAWAEQNGLVGSEISDAVGISLKDLQSNNYSMLPEIPSDIERHIDEMQEP